MQHRVSRNGDEYQVVADGQAGGLELQGVAEAECVGEHPCSITRRQGLDVVGVEADAMPIAVMVIDGLDSINPIASEKLRCRGMTVPTWPLCLAGLGWMLYVTSAVALAGGGGIVGIAGVAVSRRVCADGSIEELIVVENLPAALIVAIPVAAVWPDVQAGRVSNGDGHDARRADREISADRSA